MKTKNTKSILFILVVLFLSTISHAQNNTITYEITFTGSGQSNSIETIKVLNTTNRESVILNGTDTLHLVKTVGLKPNHVTNASVKVFPNPTLHSSRIEFFNSRSGNVSLEFLELSGKVLKAINQNLPQGRHAFELQGMGAGVFLIKIRTQEAIHIERLVSHAQAFGEPGVQYLGIMNQVHRQDNEKSSRNIVTMDYVDGERLLITGFSGPYTHTLSVIPNQSQNIDIPFIECVDGDGNNYGVVTIGEQVWMVENLTTTKDAAGNNITRFCYENNTTNCELYGGLYTWETLMNDGGGSNNHKRAQGICPAGWHVSSDAEWTQLVDYVFSQGYPNEYEASNGTGNALKSCRQENSPLGGDCNTAVHPRWHAHDTHHGFNEFGFSALPGGYRGIDGHFGLIGLNGSWWTSTEASAPGAWRRTMGRSYGLVSSYTYHKSHGLSVRCLLDEASLEFNNLNLEINPENSGSVTGNGQYTAGETVEITATTNSGWEFVNWTDEDSTVVSTLNSFLYTMPATDVTLTANFEEEETWLPCPGTPTVTDFDGNVYNTVLIGEQCWMKENLKTTSYRNGTPIQYPGESSYLWLNNTSGAYAWYNNDLNWKYLYGALYNWHAVSNNNGLCPSGWKVPSDDDWTQLVDYVVSQGFPNQGTNANGAGNAIKSCRQVNSPLGGSCNTTEHPRWDEDDYSGHFHHGFNEFGFSAVPGGHRDYYGGFYSLGSYAPWWSGTESSPSLAWSRSLSVGYASVSRVTDNKLEGHFVRCIRNEAPNQLFNLDIEINPSESGQVFGAGQYEAGEQVFILANTLSGWEFNGWTGDTTYLNDPLAAITSVTMPSQNITLTANFEINQNAFTCGTSTIADVDGNIYNTELIGDQCWMKENLKTTHYRYGVPIEYPGSNNNYWNDNIEGAYAWYENDANWKESYGALYNWYAVNNAFGLCPTGWHVPSDGDWTQLTEFVWAQGYPNDPYSSGGAANAVKSCRQINSPWGGDCTTTEHPRWNSHNINNGFDIFGYNALPAGLRTGYGSFQELSTGAFWWSSSAFGLNYSLAWYVYNEGSEIATNDFDYSYGFSIRCIKDETPVNPYFNLNLEVNPEGSGSVTGSGQYPAGNMIGITATPYAGWAFISWTDEDGAIVSTLNSFLYAMPYTDITLTANFVEEESWLSCPGTPTVIDFDGNVYNTVLMGDQCWMKENLKTTHDAAGNDITRYCFDNNSAYCELYGGLYTWATVMNGAVSSNNNPSGVQGICPEGWHLPSEDEWSQLVDYVSTQGFPNSNAPNGAGNALKSCRQVKSPLGGHCNTTVHPRWFSDNTHHGFDEFSFSALPGGNRLTNGSFYSLSSGGYWWSSTEHSSTIALCRMISYSNGDVINYSGNKSNSFSVRCLRD